MHAQNFTNFLFSAIRTNCSPEFRVIQIQTTESSECLTIVSFFQFVIDVVNLESKLKRHKG